MHQNSLGGTCKIPTAIPYHLLNGKKSILLGSLFALLGHHLLLTP